MQTQTKAKGVSRVHFRVRSSCLQMPICSQFTRQRGYPPSRYLSLLLPSPRMATPCAQLLRPDALRSLAFSSVPMCKPQTSANRVGVSSQIHGAFHSRHLILIPATPTSLLEYGHIAGFPGWSRPAGVPHLCGSRSAPTARSPSV